MKQKGWFKEISNRNKQLKIRGPTVDYFGTHKFYLRLTK